MASGDILVFSLGARYFGFDVDAVYDVVRHRRATPVPLAPASVSGVFNLRGGIVTLHDLNALLDLDAVSCAVRPMTVVLSRHRELHGFPVDGLHGIAAGGAYEPVPGRAAWHDKAFGVLRHDGMPVTVLNDIALLERTS